MLFGILLYCTHVLKTKNTCGANMRQQRTRLDNTLLQKKSRPLQNIMRKHAKAPHIQKRQSDLLMTYASNEHKAIARLIQAWLNEHLVKP